MPVAAMGLLELDTDLLCRAFSQINFGDSASRATFGSIKLACRSLNYALKDMCVDVQLQGQWTPRQIQGLCRGMPEMVSIDIGRNWDGERLVPISPDNPFITQFQAFMDCKRLLHLDIRFIGAIDRTVAWARLGDIKFPPGLQHLGLPELKLPVPLRENVNGLTSLTSLYSVHTDYYPSLELSMLADLVVGGPGRGRNSFCLHILPRLEKLTSVELQLPKTSLEAIAASTTLLRLKITGHILAAALKGLLESLPRLECLDLEDTHPPSSKDSDAPLVFPKNLSTLRALGLKNANAELWSLENTSLTAISFRGSSGQRLRESGIRWIAGMRQLKVLDLCGWDRWDDVRPLGLPSIEKLVTDQAHHLVHDILDAALFRRGAGTNPQEGTSVSECLGSLKTLICNQRVTSNNLFVRDADGVAVVEGEAAIGGPSTLVVRCLLRLPVFEVLAVSEAVADRGWVKADLKGYRGTREANEALEGIERRVVDMVGMHPNRWRCLVNEGHGRVYQLKRR